MRSDTRRGGPTLPQRATVGASLQAKLAIASFRLQIFGCMLGPRHEFSRTHFAATLWLIQ